MCNVSPSFLVNFNIRSNFLRTTRPPCGTDPATDTVCCYGNGFGSMSSDVTLSKNDIGTFAWLQFHTYLPSIRHVVVYSLGIILNINLVLLLLLPCHIFGQTCEAYCRGLWNFSVV